MIFGYARVSTPEQNIQTQIDLLQNFGCEKIFSDIASGVREDRKGLNEMLSFLREGDIIVVYKTDRIFRSLKNMIDLIEVFNHKKVSFKSLTEPAFDTTSANGKFLMQIFGAVAEFERNLISERTKAGLEGARRRNKHLGRPKGIAQETLEKLCCDFPKIERIFFKIYCQKLAEYQVYIQQILGSLSAERYLFFEKTYPHLVGRISQVQIASFLGITPECVSRLKNHFLVVSHDRR